MSSMDFSSPGFWVPRCWFFFFWVADREEQITGVFMTAQAVAKEMIRHGRGGSIAMIASMSGSVANRVSAEIIDRQSTV